MIMLEKGIGESGNTETFPKPPSQTSILSVSSDLLNRNNQDYASIG